MNKKLLIISLCVVLIVVGIIILPRLVKGNGSGDVAVQQSTEQTGEPETRKEKDKQSSGDDSMTVGDELVIELDETQKTDGL